MHLLSIIFLLFIFFRTFSISNATSPFMKYPINEHKSNIVSNLGVDFERDIRVENFDANEDVEDCVLPSDMLRLLE